MPRKYALPLLLALALLTASFGNAGQPIVSSMRNVSAVMQARGFHITPVSGGGTTYPGDLAPTQSFELVRPNGEKVTIGRLYTSCTCVRLETSKRSFERGERAIFDLRNVIATPPAGQRYALYIQITSPIRTTLRYDTFVQSSQFIVGSVSPSTTTTPAAPSDNAVTDKDGKTTSAPAIVRPDDDLDPVITIIADPHAQPEAEEPHDKYSAAKDEENNAAEAAGEKVAEETEKMEDAVETPGESEPAAVQAESTKSDEPPAAAEDRAEAGSPEKE